MRLDDHQSDGLTESGLIFAFSRITDCIKEHGLCHSSRNVRNVNQKDYCRSNLIYMLRT